MHDIGKINTQEDLTKRTQNNSPDMLVEVFWDYPKETMGCQTSKIISSGWCTGTNKKTFILRIENPLEDEYISNMLIPCLQWMKEHGAEEDESIKWKLWNLMKHSNCK